MPERVLFAVEQVAQVLCEQLNGVLEFFVAPAVVVRALVSLVVQAVKLDDQMLVVDLVFVEEVDTFCCRHDDDLFALVGGVDLDVHQRCSVIRTFARTKLVLVVALGDDVLRDLKDSITRDRYFQVDLLTDQRGELRHCYSLVDAARLCEQGLVALQDPSERVAGDDAGVLGERHEAFLSQVLVGATKFAVDDILQDQHLAVAGGDDLKDGVRLATGGVAIARG